jgi:hypothetical protein
MHDVSGNYSSPFFNILVLSLIFEIIGNGIDLRRDTQFCADIPFGS